MTRQAAAAPQSDPGPLPRPIVKWAGGKTRLLDELVARAPTSWRRYYEPFMGGAALFFRLRPERAFLSDVNADLVECHAAVRDDVESVIAELRRHADDHDARGRHYRRMKAAWNDAKRGATQPRLLGDRLPEADRLVTPAGRAAAFIYLNKTCFNGLHRVNRLGEFNVPMGRYDDPAILSEPALRASSEVLGRADVRTASYEDAVAKAGERDLVYFDPPYDPVSESSSFTAYTATGFGPHDQARLAEAFRELDRRGCRVMLSNSDTKRIRRLYAGYRIDRVTVGRAINSKVGARGGVSEIIVTNRQD